MVWRRARTHPLSRMKITLKLFASLTDYLPTQDKYTNHVELDISPETTIRQLVEKYRMPEKLVHLVLVNGSYVAPEQRPSQTLKEGDVLAVWPPIAGG
jgi:sulfur-carrier protein